MQKLLDSLIRREDVVTGIGPVGGLDESILWSDRERAHSQPKECIASGTMKALPKSTTIRAFAWFVSIPLLISNGDELFFQPHVKDHVSITNSAQINLNRSPGACKFTLQRATAPKLGSTEVLMISEP